MLTLFLVSFLLAVFISCFCSLMEASLYAVPISYVNMLEKQNKRSGIILKKFKENISRPIAAILILNTIANTAGAAISGWAAGELYGSQFLIIFSIAFTLIILYFSEIIPKIIGVVYCKQIASFIALPLEIILKILKPLVFLSEGLGRIIQNNKSKQTLSISELLTMTEIGQREGSIDELEGSVIRNIIGLDKILVKDIFTPRVVVFRLPDTTTLQELKSEIFNWNFTRVPIYSEDKEDLLTAYVTQRDIYRYLLEEPDQTKTLQDIARPLTTVPELMHADKLLLRFIENREHISAVVDEHGSLVGIITLEDLLEAIVGKEIVDEYDSVKNLRNFAQNKKNN